MLLEDVAEVEAVHRQVEELVDCEDELVVLKGEDGSDDGLLLAV